MLSLAGSQRRLISSGGDTHEGSPVQEGGTTEPDEGGAPQQDVEEAVPEKLADDDTPKDPLWKRVLYWLFPKLRRGEFTGTVKGV